MSVAPERLMKEDKFIRRLMPRHFKILDLAMGGHDSKVIAELVGMDRKGIENIMKSPLFQAELVRRRKESDEGTVIGLDRQATLGKARSILEQASVAAAEKCEELMEAQDPAIQLRAASNILDRVFGKTSDGGSAPVINISAEQVLLLNQALKESNYVHTPVPAAQGSADQPLDVRQECPTAA